MCAPRDIFPFDWPVDPDLFTDGFAGGGGTSLGFELATGISPSVAINHCAHAILMHRANHPTTLHFQEDIHEVWPPQATQQRRPRISWFSPDCKHFSRAKGKRPRDKKIRGLAWTVITWAKTVRPLTIILENVWEFTTWGPLHPDDHMNPKLRGQPIKERKGETFHEFLSQLQALGYTVEWKKLNAATFGAPTARWRLFLVAACDGELPQWPEPTHGPGCAEPFHTAAECIDWDVPIPSIFTRKKPLAERTQARIAEGMRRYVLGTARPFLLCLTHGGRLEPLDEPHRTITTANRGERAIVVPIMEPYRSGSAEAPVDQSMSTVTGHGHHAVVAATLINTRNGERKRQRPRARDIQRPLGTVTSQGSQGALVSAFLARHAGGPNGHPSYGRMLTEPTGTITARDTQGLVSVWLDKLHGSARAGVPIDEPAPTVTAGGDRGGGHAALCAAFLVKYYGEGGQWSPLNEPMHTIVERARMGLVIVTIHGEDWVLVDIGMRMLTPRELARAQGFPDSYRLIGTKSQQIARIGNSVPPPVVAALVRAQLGGRRSQPRPAPMEHRMAA